MTQIWFKNKQRSCCADGNSKLEKMIEESSTNEITKLDEFTYKKEIRF
jgi:hypothetical protein